ncbi:site-specific integrase [Pseudoteredinibacter isoporae]|uniref:site-specific integrase n=1 Tax=Pseudoteredinibacter isoporae TaxID=570281 RepID=UPI0031054F71
MVGRRKNPADNWMPPRVYRGRSKYEWKPKGGKVTPLRKLPADGKESEAVKRDVWKAYDQAVMAVQRRETMAFVIDLYFASPQFKRLSVRTQQDYKRYQGAVVRVFGNMEPKKVKPPHIRKFMDVMGEDKPVTANRHHSFLSVVFSWADERGIVDGNPAKRVKKFLEQSRERYIEDWEYKVVYEVARTSPYKYIAAMMELAYLCRGRSSEIRNLSETDIGDKGIYLARTKGSDDELTLWTPRLQAAVDFARSLYPEAPAPMDRPLFRGRTGARLLDSSRKTAWSRIMKTALTTGAAIDGKQVILKERFTFHDIKAKGISDHKANESGHKSARMKAVYMRKLKEVEATD